MDPAFDEEERARVYHAIDRTTMVLLDPPVTAAVIAAVEAMQNAVGLMIEQDVDRAAATGSIVGAVVQMLMLP